MDNVNYIGFCDMASSSMMITVYNSIEKEYVYFEYIKCPDVSLNHTKHITKTKETINVSNNTIESSDQKELWLLKDLYILSDLIRIWMILIVTHISTLSLSELAVLVLLIA